MEYITGICYSRSAVRQDRNFERMYTEVADDLVRPRTPNRKVCPSQVQSCREKSSGLSLWGQLSRTLLYTHGVPEGTRDAVSYDSRWRGKLERGQELVFTKFLPTGRQLASSRFRAEPRGTPSRAPLRFSGLTKITNVGTRPRDIMSESGARTLLLVSRLSPASSISLCSTARFGSFGVIIDAVETVSFWSLSFFRCRFSSCRSDKTLLEIY